MKTKESGLFEGMASFIGSRGAKVRAAAAGVALVSAVCAAPVAQATTVTGYIDSVFVGGAVFNWGGGVSSDFAGSIPSSLARMNFSYDTASLANGGGIGASDVYSVRLTSLSVVSSAFTATMNITSTANGPEMFFTDNTNSIFGFGDFLNLELRYTPFDWAMNIPGMSVISGAFLTHLTAVFPSTTFDSMGMATSATALGVDFPNQHNAIIGTALRNGVPTFFAPENDMAIWFSGNPNLVITSGGSGGGGGATVPEPSSLALLMAAGAAMGWAARRKGHSTGQAIAA